MSPRDLSDLLRHEAEQPHFRPVDLDATVSRGIRLRRRRVAVATTSLVAVAAVVTTLVLGVTGDRSPRAVEPAGGDDGASSSVPLTWAQDGVIHVGSRQIRPAHGVVVFLQVDDRLIVQGTDRKVREVSTDGDERILDPSAPAAASDLHPRLLTDGRWVGWSTGGVGGAVEAHFVRLDGGAEPRAMVLPESPWRDRSALAAMDDGIAYLQLQNGVGTLRLDDPSTQQVDLALSTGRTGEVVAVHGDTVLRYADELRVGTLRDSGSPLLVDGRPLEVGRGVLSPGGSAYAPDAEHLTVVGLDGTDRSPDAGSRYAYFSTAYQWLDGDHVAAIALESEQGPSALLTCGLDEGTCRTEVRLDTTDGLVLPVGDQIG